MDGRPVWYYTDDSAPVFCYPVERPKYSGTITGTVGYRKQLSTASVTFPQVKDAEGNVVAGEWSFNKPDQIIKTTGTKTVYATYKCQNSAAYDDIKNAKVTLTIQESILALPMKVTVKNKKVSAANLKKKSVTLIVLTVKNAKGKVTYKITDGNKKSKKALKIDSKTGKIKVKKKTKKGTYKVKVKVTAAGNDYYYAGYKTVKVSIKVK